MESIEKPRGAPYRKEPFELSPYPSTIVNRSALPESWYFWRRRRRKRKHSDGT